MLTKWAKKLLPYIYASSNYASTFPVFVLNSYNSRAAFVEGKDYSGTTRYFEPTFQTPSFSNITGSSITASSNGVAFGSSDTPATDEDYTIGSKIDNLTASLSPASTNAVSNSYDSTNDESHNYVDLTVTNNNSEAVTIKEICKFGLLFYSATKGSVPASASDKVSVLIDRTVLDAPVTIQPGESAVIRYDFIVSNS